MFQTVNKRVAVTPFEVNQARAEVVGGLARIKQRHELTKLTVVYASENSEYLPGDVVVVRSETCVHDFSKQVHELEESKPFIMMPFDMILMVNHGDYDNQEVPF